MTTTKKKLLALAVLSIGIIPSIPVDFASAIVPNQVDLQRHCRNRLGFGQTEPLYGSLLLQLRRCVDNTRVQYEHAARLLNRKGNVHYAQYFPGQSAPKGKETQRSLNTRMENAENSRITYYRTVGLEDREFLLQDHRRSRRLLVQEAEQRLLRQRREHYQRWRQSIQTCRYYVRENRHDCERFQLSR